MPATGDKQEPREERRSNVQKALDWFKDVPTFWKGVGVVASTVATILGILTFLFPSLQRQPPPSETWADLSDLKAGPSVSLEEYIQRPGVPTSARRDAETSVAEEDRKKVGRVVYFDLEAKGYQGEPIRIVWSLSEADTGKLIGGLTAQKAWPNSLIEPKSQSRKLALETWVPLPRERKGPFVVGLEVFGGGESEGRLEYEEVTIGSRNGAS